MNPIALITGATSGIGRATALKMAGNQYDVIITGRREERLVELRDAIKKRYDSRVHILSFDIRDQNAVVEAVDSLPKEWKNIRVLINNAGLAVGLNHIQDGKIDDWERMIDTNVKGLLYISRKVAPMMIEKGDGHIVNIGSMAGKEVYEKGNVYCATKHAVEALTKSMRIDMLKDNIKVTSISPGLVETEFSIVRFKGDKEKADKTYKGYNPLTGDDVADVVVFAINMPAHVNLNNIEVTPRAQANSFYKNINP
ncbi:MAG TPA: SDR family NAD(P)-dependent oxidoreductase [Bacteroidales bacterium]|nr:SDR family NAD(P)-dependent oxidoreductase [Bacteroidales bacterium]